MSISSVSGATAAKAGAPRIKTCPPHSPEASEGGMEMASLFSQSAMKHFALQPPEGDSRPHMGYFRRDTGHPLCIWEAVEDAFVKESWWGPPPRAQLPELLNAFKEVYSNPSEQSSLGIVP